MVMSTEYRSKLTFIHIQWGYLGEKMDVNPYTNKRTKNKRHALNDTN